MRKILPVELQAKVTTECWNYYKLAIIQTMPDYEKWLSSHLNLSVGINTDEVYFGAYGKPHNSDYFSDILDIREYNIYELSSETIIEWVKTQIDQDWYCSVFLGSRWENLHECFIYGYDCEALQFYTISLNEWGHFQENIVSFGWLQDGYRNLIRFYQSHPDLYLSKKSFNFLVSCLKPCDKYLTKDYAGDYIDKIVHEVYGTRTEMRYSRRNGAFTELPKTYYTGVTCMLRMKTILEALGTEAYGERLEQKDYVNRLRVSMYKLAEHQAMLSDAMLWYENAWQINDPELINARKTYEIHSAKMKKLCILFMKFLVARDKELLARISEKIGVLYREEKECLGVYEPKIEMWYFQHVLPRALEKAT